MASRMRGPVFQNGRKFKTGEEKIAMVLNKRHLIELMDIRV
jgi:hypothetical protein